MITTELVNALVKKNVTASGLAAELNRLLKISIASQIAAGMLANSNAQHWTAGEVVQDAADVADLLMRVGARKAKVVRKAGRDS